MKTVQICDVNRPLMSELPFDGMTRNIGIVVPTFKGEGHLEAFLGNLTSQLSKLDQTYVVALIDDGSPQDLAPDFERIVRRHENVIVGALYKNKGQHFATSIGVSLLSKCEIIVTIDDDVLVPENFFPDLMSLFSDQNVDLIFAKTRNSSKIGRRLMSKLVSFLVRQSTNQKTPITVTSTRAFRGYLVELLPHPDPVRYLTYDLMNVARNPIQMSMSVPTQSPRPSTYRLRDLYKHLSRLLMNHDEWLVKLLSIIAIPVCLILGSLGAYFTLTGALMGIHVRGWLSLFLLTSLIGSINFLCIALLGKYLGSVLRQLSQPKTDTKILVERVRFFFANGEVK